MHDDIGNRSIDNCLLNLGKLVQAHSQNLSRNSKVDQSFIDCSLKMSITTDVFIDLDDTINQLSSDYS